VKSKKGMALRATTDDDASTGQDNDFLFEEPDSGDEFPVHMELDG
jgi:hypothetical protein